MPEFNYQTLQVEPRAPMTGGPSPRGVAAGAGVKLLHKASVALNNLAVSYRVNREIAERSEEIQRRMPPNGGVLLCAGIQEWARPDATGTRAQMFLSLHIAGAGADPHGVLHGYLMQPRWVHGAAPGWRRRDVFIWATAAPGR
jgi:hypothetical protein